MLLTTCSYGLIPNSIFQILCGPILDVRSSAQTVHQLCIIDVTDMYSVLFLFMSVCYGKVCVFQMILASLGKLDVCLKLTSQTLRKFWKSNLIKLSVNNMSLYCTFM